MTRQFAVHLTLLLACGALAATPPTTAEVTEISRYQRLARDILAELIEIDTTDSRGDTTVAARAMAARLQAAFFSPDDILVDGSDPRKGNLVVRYRGTGARAPILLLAHLDVVEAKREDWSFDPFEFREEDGYFYGRGSSDDKGMAAIWMANLMRLREEGFVPDRDLVLALTADEEGGNHNGVSWLLANHRDRIAAAYCLNEGGWGAIRDGRYLSHGIQPSEKVYMTLRLEVSDPGGHSSVPKPDNPIYRLAAGLVRLGQFDFPVRLSEVTRRYVERMAAIEGGDIGAAMLGVLADPPDPRAVDRLSEVPYYNALLRTTCVATRLEAGHAENALPQTARATVNCRLLPEESPAEIRRTIAEILGDEAIALTTTWEPLPSPPSPLDTELMRAVEALTEEMWPGVPVIPVMLTGSTDGLYLRNAGIPTYGISGIFHDLDDIRAHGRDERVGVRQFYEGQEFLYRLLRRLSSR